jgi:hypothetical protein
MIVETTVSAVSGPQPGTHSLTGKASWYCKAGRSPCMKIHPDTAGFDAYAAAGPRLRAAMCGGNQASNCWRGRIVSVNGVRVILADWCQCGWHQSWEKVIDLYHDVFVVTGGQVTIRW